MNHMKKRLTKSSNNKVISGVLGGIADYFGIDPTIVRVVYVILSVLSQAFPGVLVYICLAIIMPDGKKRRSKSRYGHENDYYQKNDPSKRAKRKDAEKVEDDDDDEDWSDF